MHVTITHAHHKHYLYNVHSLAILKYIVRITTHSNPHPSTSGFQHMARMMDSLILDNFPPYTLTKITTSTHRPAMRSTGGGASKSKLNGGLTLHAGAASMPLMSTGAAAATAACSPAGRPNHIALQARTKIPMQGKRGHTWTMTHTHTHTRAI